MKSMKRFLTLLSLVLLLTACGDASRDPVIKGYSIRQVGGLAFGINGVTADVMLDLDVENPSGARYTVEALQATVFPTGDTTHFADIYLKDKAIIQPHSNDKVEIPLDVRLRRPLALLGGGLSGELSRYEADIDLVVRRGAAKRHIRQSRVPLAKVAELLGSILKTDNNQSHEEE